MDKVLTPSEFCKKHGISEKEIFQCVERIIYSIGYTLSYGRSKEEIMFSRFHVGNPEEGLTKKVHHIHDFIIIEIMERVIKTLSSSGWNLHYSINSKEERVYCNLFPCDSAEIFR